MSGSTSALSSRMKDRVINRLSRLHHVHDLRCNTQHFISLCWSEMLSPLLSSHLRWLSCTSLHLQCTSSHHAFDGMSPKIAERFPRVTSLILICVPRPPVFIASTSKYRRVPLHCDIPNVSSLVTIIVHLWHQRHSDHYHHHQWSISKRRMILMSHSLPCTSTCWHPLFICTVYLFVIHSRKYVFDARITACSWHRSYDHSSVVHYHPTINFVRCYRDDDTSSDSSVVVSGSSKQLIHVDIAMIDSSIMTRLVTVAPDTSIGHWWFPTISIVRMCSDISHDWFITSFATFIDSLLE